MTCILAVPYPKLIRPMPYKSCSSNLTPTCVYCDVTLGAHSLAICLIYLLYFQYFLLTFLDV